MTEHIASAWESLAQFLTNKITSVVVASGVIVGAQTTPAQFINLAEDGFWLFTYKDWITVIGCLWITVLLFEKVGVFRGAAWLWRKAWNR